MRELLARIVFGLVMILLYFVGNYVNPIINSWFGLDIDFKVLLPIILGLGFVDSWLRFLTKFLVKFEIRKVITERGITITNNLVYYGKDPVAVSLREISGISDVNAEITYSNKNNNTFSYPTNYSINLSPIEPTTTIKIDLFFKRDPKPQIRIYGHELYILKLLFRIGATKKLKILFIHRRKEG